MKGKGHQYGNYNKLHFSSNHTFLRVNLTTSQLVESNNLSRPNIISIMGDDHTRQLDMFSASKEIIRPEWEYSHSIY